MITYYVVQSFQRSPKGRLLPDQPVQARSEADAIAKADRLSRSKPCVVAFSRSGDETTGDYNDAVIIIAHGLSHEELERAAA